MFSIRTIISAAVLIAVSGVRAETHTVTFTNKCGFGTVRVLDFLYIMVLLNEIFL